MGLMIEEFTKSSVQNGVVSLSLPLLPLISGRCLSTISLRAEQTRTWRRISTSSSLGEGRLREHDCCRGVLCSSNDPVRDRVRMKRSGSCSMSSGSRLSDTISLIRINSGEQPSTSNAAAIEDLLRTGCLLFTRLASRCTMGEC